MAKIRIHELAKELKIENKELLQFLAGKGIEGKTASSGLDAAEEQMVRAAFGGGAPKKAESAKNAEAEKKADDAKKSDAAKKAPKADDKKAEEKSQAPVKTAVAPKAEEKSEKAPAKAPTQPAPENKPATEQPKAPAQQAAPQAGDANRAPAPQGGDAQAAPKKKKTIIIVNNQQNSRNQGPRGNAPQQGRPQGQGGRPGYGNGGYNNGYNNGRPGQQQAPRTPIRPLTPPSPTPSVQMVNTTPSQTKRVNPAPEKKENENVNVTNTPVVENVTPTTAPENTAPVKPTHAPTQEQKAPTTQQGASERRPQQGGQGQGQGGQTGPRNGQYVPREGQGGYNRQGGQYGQRDGQGQGGYNRQGGQYGQRDGQGQGGYNRQGGQYGQRDGQGQGGYNRQGGQYGQRDGQGQGGYNRQGGQYGQRDGQGQGGYNRQGGQFGGRDGQGGRTGQYQGGSRDGRGGFSGQGGRPGQGQFGGRDARGSKSFGGDSAPAKDMEKKREEDKRRFSQERDKRNKKDYMYEEDEAAKNKPGRFIKPEKKKEETVEEVIKVITLPETITIKDLADKMKQQPAALIKKLFMEGKIVTVNQEISYDEAEALAMDYEILCEKEVKVDVIEELLKEDEENEADLVERPPVICVMGHVDHGKTSLLDAIRKTNVTDKEAGGITQHIGAYTVSLNGRDITFLDTPGHEAFTAMRMRGANSTDIAILVVAADDGVMPQTIEAINHAKAAGIEIVVAVNKIDKPSANIERVKQELTEYELVATDWGGNTEFVPVSAKTGQGIEDLLETILLTADILELKANPNRKARGLVIEAELDKGRGPVATVLVQKGTLRVGDFISAGACHGKVRAMVDDKGRRVKEATPSTPVEILGLNDVPSAGEVFLAHDSDKTAKTYAETYMAQNKEKMLEETKGKMSLDDLFSQIKEGNLKELNLIVKADVQGSVEAVKTSLLKLSNDEVVVKCIHGGVGAINESDVVLASASNAIIIGFNVRPDATAKATAEREGVDVRLYKVIYQAIEDVEAAMKGMLDPIFEEKVIGHAEVRQIFRASAIGNIAGSYVLDGVFQRDCKIRITREGEQIYEGKLASLKRFKDDVKEVKAGFECGLVFDGFDQMQEFDVVEAYVMVEVPR
ncbi:MAG: translation initiation factor IF-2 [Lachnospiraceae bacterium]|nr:translation initiation factor IF-2 [Lachnospiraceae bacterium]